MITDGISQMFPEFDFKELKSMASWASESWVKKVKFDDDMSMLRSYAVASTISTEFDVSCIQDKWIPRFENDGFKSYP